MLRLAWLGMNGLLLLYGLWLGVTSVIDGRLGNLVPVGLIVIAVLATVGLLIRDQNDRGAAAVAVAFGATLASLGIGAPLPSVLIPWGYTAVMLWGLLATFIPAFPGELIWSPSGPALPKSPALSPAHRAQMNKAQRSDRLKSVLGKR